MSESGIEYCQDCGWAHANVPGCWRKVHREAVEKLADPSLSEPIREQLQAALDALDEANRDIVHMLTVAMGES